MCCLVQLGALLRVQPVHRLVDEVVLAGPRAVVHAEDVEQRRLAGARRPHDRDELALLDVEVDAAQDVGAADAVRVRLLDVAQRDEHLQGFLTRPGGPPSDRRASRAAPAGTRRSARRRAAAVHTAANVAGSDGADAEEQVVQQPRAANRAPASPTSNPVSAHLQRLRHHHAADVAWLRAERHADADLAGSAAPPRRTSRRTARSRPGTGPGRRIRAISVALKRGVAIDCARYSSIVRTSPAARSGSTAATA